jgi:hypothetical protein
MRWKVSVTRIATASRDIEVEADTREEAESKAEEQACNEDFTCCVNDFEFGVDGVTPLDGEEEENDEPSPDLTSEEKRCPDLGDGVCSVCQKTPFPGVSREVIDAGWLPSFFEGQEECEGPVCPQCSEQFIREVEGEWALLVDGEYVSVWDGGVEVKSPCTVDPRTRKIEIEHAADVDGLETMEREYVVLNGKEYKAVNEEYRYEFTPEGQSRMFFWE